MLLCIVISFALAFLYSIIVKKILFKDNTVISSTIRKILETKMEEKNYNINSLSTKAGLTPFTVRKFFNGETNSPSFDIIYQIAETLDCSLDELTGRTKFLPKEQPAIQDYPWHSSLYEKIVKTICGYSEEKNINLSLSSMHPLIDEAYAFSINQNNGKPDDKFIKWLVDKSTDKSLF
jgi:transcriptional regulator with XRE-family HTH domain